METNQTPLGILLKFEVAVWTSGANTAFYGACLTTTPTVIRRVIGLNLKRCHCRRVHAYQQKHTGQHNSKKKGAEAGSGSRPSHARREGGPVKGVLYRDAKEEEARALGGWEGKEL